MLKINNKIFIMIAILSFFADFSIANTSDYETLLQNATNILDQPYSSD